MDLRNEVNKLLALIRDNNNTKREIKEAAWILDKQVDAVMDRVDGLLVKETNEMATQTEPEVGAMDVAEASGEEVEAQLETGVAPEQLPGLVSRKWPGRCFRFTEVKEGFPEEEAGQRVAVVLDLGGNKKGDFARGVCDRAPRICRMLNDRKVTPGSVLRDSVGAEVLLGEANGTLSETFVLAVDQELPMGEMARHVVEGLQKIEGVAGGAIPVAMVAGKGMSCVRRLQEYMARRDGVHRVIYAAKEEPGRRRTATIPSKPATPTRTVVIQKEGLSYAQLLREVKAGTGDELAGAVVSAKKGRGEGLEIKITDTAGEAKALSERIQGRLQGVRITPGGRGERPIPVVVKGLDCEVTKEELLQAVKVALPDEEHWATKVTSLRSAYGQAQNATVVLARRAAEVLLARERLRIGWQSCRVLRWEEDPRCYRCWEQGHRAATCKGPDRSKACYNCGGAGHYKRDCKEQPNCSKCKMAGHSFGDRCCKGTTGQK